MADDLLVLGLAAAGVPAWFTAALFAGLLAAGWVLWRAER